MIADRVGEYALCVPGRLASRGARHRRATVRLANGTLPWPWIDPDKALPWVEAAYRLELAESQAAAIRLALMSKVLVITGGPGVGKTTIVKAHPAHPRGQGRRPPALRTDRPRRQADDRGDWV